MVGGLPPAGKAIDIVKDGRAVAVIVAAKAGGGLAQGDVRKERLLRQRQARPRAGGAKARGFECDDLAAADVLAEWVEKITDVRLEVVNQAPASGPVIYVGSAAIKAGLNLTDINSPTSEGLRIISDGQTKILIAGQNETATMKAVCRFLEELGCRYFMDNVLGEVYPRSKTVTVGKLNITEKPGLMLRKIWGSGWSGQSLWKVWNGAGGLPMDTGHAWGRYIDEKLFDAYPEYFALRRETGTLLAVSGVHPKVAQSIMRHSDINLTMSLYTHRLRGQESKAIAKLPELSKQRKLRGDGTG
jgi:hypothetical protein